METTKYEELVKSISEVMENYEENNTENINQIRKSENFNKFMDTFKDTANSKAGTRIINL